MDTSHLPSPQSFECVLTLDISVDLSLSYSHNKNVEIGQIVIANLRGKLQLGYVESCKEVSIDDLHQHVQNDENNKEKKRKNYTLKPLVKVLPYTLLQPMIHFLRQAASYTMIAKGHLFGMSVISLKDIEKEDVIEALPLCPVTQFLANSLNPEQTLAYERIAESIGRYTPFVLDGVTGSGKTEVYFAAVLEVLKRGGKALVLLPEIALTQAIVDRFEKAFHVMPFVWHSHITPAKKRKLWKTLMQPGPAVILGARSALFVPVPDLGLIIVDEEHDSSYKQTEQGVYNARDLAVLRAYCEGCPVVLGSATPSLETWNNVRIGKYQHLLLQERYNSANLPAVTLVNRGSCPNDSLISPELDKAICTTLKKNEQILLFINRRGFSPMLICFGCGYRFECPACHVVLTTHKHSSQALCHYCGYHTPEPSQCPSCKSSLIKDIGWGVEKVAQDVQERYPKARVLCISSDMLSNAKVAKELFQHIHNRDYDIIVGTQVLAKGHHFPYLTCVGILDADKGLSMMDLRASERTFQMLSQVTGRAGRDADKKGHVFLQTLNPDHPLFIALQEHDRHGFYDIELGDREVAHMPPFSRLIGLIVSSLSEETLLQACRKMSQYIPSHPDFEVMGPTPAPLYRLRSRYRMRFLIRSDIGKNIQAFTKLWLQSCNNLNHVDVHIDVDPLSFL